jgi:hypothetical protein
MFLHVEPPKTSISSGIEKSNRGFRAGVLFHPDLIYRPKRERKKVRN